MLTYCIVNKDPPGYRVLTDGVGIGLISNRENHVTHAVHWRWGIDTMPLISGRTPDGDTETFEAELQAFKVAFLKWHAELPPGAWERSLEHKRHSQDRLRPR